jgi:hypothetical protein
MLAAMLGLLQFGKTGDVDDQFRLDQPQIEHRTERLAAGDDPGRGLAFRQYGKRGRQVARAFVSESSRLHAAGLSAPRAARIASTTR